MKNMFIRLLACLMMAAMLISGAAMAEMDLSALDELNEQVQAEADRLASEAAEIETVEWTDANGMIKFNIPADWTELDGELVTQLVNEMLSSGALDEAGANEYTKQMMAQVESVYAFFYAADFVGNMNIGIADVGGENMVPAFDVIKTSFEAQYQQMGATVNSFELSSFGGRDAIVCKIEYLGIEQTQVMIQPSDYSALITFTFAGSAQEAVDVVMNSVVLSE